MMKPISKRLLARPWIFVTGIFLLVAIGALFAVRPIVSAKMEQTFVEQAERRGIELTWENASWDPWRGQHFTGMKASGTDQEDAFIAEVGSISFRPSLGMYFGIKGGSLTCNADSSPLKLRDEAGSLRMDDVSLSMTILEGKVEIDNLTIERDGLTLDLNGRILLRAPSEKQEKFRPDLKIFRAIFATLDVEAGTGPFQVEGSFRVDHRKSPIAWTAELKGEGDNFEWKGVRWTDAKAQGKISSEGARITYDLTTAHGATSGNVKHSGNKDDPFVFDGELSDSSGESDTYRAGFLDGTIRLESLEGTADLWEISNDIPAFRAERPESIRFEKFPGIELKNLVSRMKEGNRETTVESIRLSSPHPVEFTVRKQTVKAADFSAQGSFDGKSWILEKSHADLLGGHATLSGSYRGGVLRNANADIKRVNVSEVRGLFGKKPGSSSGLLTADFKGTIHFRDTDWEGTGSMRMTDTPVVEVPLLDQAYELFNTVIPGLEREKQGQFEADFNISSQTAEVTRFEASGGKSLTVSAVGEVDLRKKRVQGRARGKLVGLPGVVTSPLSHLLEMEVSGPYDDIRVKPLGPAKLASATVDGTVGVAIETIEEAGKITGTVIKEGLKLPFKLINPKDDDSGE